MNVIATMRCGSTPRATRCAIFAVMTRVLPLPAPASTSSGHVVARTASRCAGLSGNDIEVDAGTRCGLLAIGADSYRCDRESADASNPPVAWRIYAIGDIQGCHAEFCQLLELIGFSPRDDRLWLTGDLVNRGPDSLAVLREVNALGDAAVTVLGNHDLHLLTVAAGHRHAHRDDTLAPILEAPDRDELLDWLRAAAARRRRRRHC